MEVAENDLKHVLLLIKFAEEKVSYRSHIDHIGNDWYQLHSLGCQYLGLPLL